MINIMTNGKNQVIFMFAHNVNELRMNLVVQDIENEPVIIMTIKPYNYGLLSDEESSMSDEELEIPMPLKK